MLEIHAAFKKMNLTKTELKSYLNLLKSLEAASSNSKNVGSKDSK